MRTFVGLIVDGLDEMIRRFIVWAERVSERSDHEQIPVPRIGPLAGLRVIETTDSLSIE